MELLDETKFELFLNMIGGHSFIIKIGNGRLIKSASSNEINFYMVHNNFNFSNFFPQYFGIISREFNSLEYRKIEIFFCKIKKVFKKYLSNLSDKFKDDYQRLSFFKNLNIENNVEFDDKLNNFLNNYDNEYLTKLSNEGKFHSELNIESEFNIFFVKIEKDLNYFCEDKLKWILFWFIKWEDTFLNNDFVIIEDLTHKLEVPAIIDLKLGFHQKKKKNNFTVKTFPLYCKDLGLRIMGIQSYYESINNYNFKNRYECKSLQNDEFKNEIFNFFKINNIFYKEIIQITIQKLHFLIKNFDDLKLFTMPYSSLIILYDAEFFNTNKRFFNSANDIEYDKVIIKLIDFSFFDFNNEKNNFQNKNLVNLIGGNCEKNLKNALENVVDILSALLV